MVGSVIRWVSLDSVALIVGLAVFAWQALLAVAAERGRRSDLVKKAYKGRQSFQLALLIPYTNPQHLPDLQHLLRAIDQQEYPTSRLSVHIACTPETAADFENGLLNPNVRYWVLPPTVPAHQSGAVRQWLIERSMALQPADWLVMLQATDLIKPDFCSSVASYGFEFSVFQGYVGTRHSNLGGKVTQASSMERLEALHGRVFNRVEQAGRFHAGLACVLQSSGWAIRPDVLERLPYPALGALDTLAYTLQLSAADIRVGWAPGMVVFQRNRLRLFGWLGQRWQAALYRVRLMVSSASLFWGRAIAEGRLTDALEWLLLGALPGWLLGAGLTLLAITASWQNRPTLGRILGRSAFSVVVVGLQLTAAIAALAVARSRWNDALFAMWLTPLAGGGFGGVNSPLVALYGLRNVGCFLSKAKRHHQSGYRQHGSTRLNESLAPLHNVLTMPASQESVVDYLAAEGEQVISDQAVVSSGCRSVFGL
ncbi:MAG: hypothetical protein U0003_03455 [Vampirovibrionales bacterium]